MIRDRHDLPDHIISDLSRKLGDDVAQRIRMTTQLVDSAGDRFAVAIMACGTSIGWAAGFSQQKIADPDMTPEQHVDLMWAILRPIALAALGGSDADFRELLRHCRD